MRTSLANCDFCYGLIEIQVDLHLHTRHTADVFQGDQEGAMQAHREVCMVQVRVGRWRELEYTTKLVDFLGPVRLSSVTVGTPRRIWNSQGC